MDFSTDAIMTTDQILSKYLDQLPSGLIGSVNMPEWFQQATKRTRSHLIETQRLLSIELDEERRFHPRNRPARAASVVEKDATDLAERINRILQQYANESQKLDQTFPKRIIEQRDITTASEDDIRSRLQGLSLRRDALVDVGIIDEALSEPIQPSDVFRRIMPEEYCQFT